MSHREMFYVIDGRHRLWAAVYRGIRALRCDVLHADGRVALQIIPIEQLEPDPDVQQKFTFNKKKAQEIADNWDEGKLGVIAVVPAKEKIPKARKAAVKLGRDKDRRRVPPLEHFLGRVMAEEPQAVYMDKVHEEFGYKTAWTGGSPPRPFTHITAVSTLDLAHSTLGREGYRRMFALATNWYDEPTTNTRYWLEGLALFVGKGYDQKMKPHHWEKLNSPLLIPAKVIAKAVGAATPSGYRGGSRTSDVGPLIAEAIRKRARLQPR